jgi:hypothetical protein
VDILTYALLMEDAQTMTTEEQCQVSTEVMNRALAAILSIGEPPARPFLARLHPERFRVELSEASAVCASRWGCREEGRCPDTAAAITLQRPTDQDTRSEEIISG